MHVLLSETKFENEHLSTIENEDTNHQDDVTLSIINKPKHPKETWISKNKMEGPTSKKTKEPPMRRNHKREHQNNV
jgi:hypothetical protein